MVRSHIGGGEAPDIQDLFWDDVPVGDDVVDHGFVVPIVTERKFVLVFVLEEGVVDAQFILCAEVDEYVSSCVGNVFIMPLLHFIDYPVSYSSVEVTIIMVQSLSDSFLMDVWSCS